MVIALGLTAEHLSKFVGLLNEYCENEQYPWLIIITGWGSFVSSKTLMTSGFQKIFRSPHALRNAIEYRHLPQAILARKTA